MIATKDCYGNTPSQIFDDHVTEPVLDEIRFIIREVIKGPLTLQEHHCGEGTGSSATDKRSSDSHRLRLESSVTASLDASRVQGTAGGGRLSSGSVDVWQDSSNTEGRTNLAPETVKHPPAHDKEGVVFRGGPSASRVTAKRCAPSILGEPSGLVVKDEQGDRLGVLSAGDEKDSPTISSDHGNAEAIAGAVSEKRCPPRASSFSRDGPSKTGTLAPPLTLKLPWEDETKSERATAPSRGGSTGSAAADTACGRDASAQALGNTDTAVVGLTYPGPRPLSAPLVRTSISAARLNSTSPILSGRRFEGTSAMKGRHGCSTRDGSRSLGRTTGATLAGTLMSYATRPGGTFDVFAAARDGQVSVLKQALTEGEEVDVQDGDGLTALMWAARAGRLSTAKYLVSQGASLVRRDDTTGFSPLHFAAYYCRSSVVRVLVLAGADKNASDKRGKVPGECFQPMSYLSYKAFYHRRLIARFLAGDMNDGMLDKGKTMFPMNSPLEAYDEEHRPQCLLGSNEKMAAPSDRCSTNQGRREPEQGSPGPGMRSSSRSHTRPRPETSYRRASYRRASADAARKAYATMHTMASTVEDGSAVRKRSTPAIESSGGRPNGGVRYYLRRGSIRQVAAITKEIIGGNNVGNQESGSDSSHSRGRSGSSKRRGSFHSQRLSNKGGAEGGINFYLRRASLHRVPFIENFLSGSVSSGERDTSAITAAAAAAAIGRGEITQPNHDVDGDGAPAVAIVSGVTTAAVTAEAAAAATSSASTVKPRTAGGRSKDGDIATEDRNHLDTIEAGTGSADRDGSGKENGVSVASDDRKNRRGEVGEGAGGAGGRGAGQRVRRLSARVFRMIQGSAEDLSAQREGERAPSDNRSAAYETSDVESGKSVPSPSGSNVENASSAASFSSRQQEVSRSPSQSRRQRRSRNHHRHKKTRCAGVDSHDSQKAKICTDAASSGDDGGHRSSGEMPRSKGRRRVGREDASGAVVAAAKGAPAEDTNRPGEEPPFIEEGHFTEDRNRGARPSKQPQPGVRRRPSPLSAGSSPEQPQVKGSPAPAPKAARPPSVERVSLIPPEKPREVAVAATPPDHSEEIGNRSNLRHERNPSTAFDAPGTELLVDQDEETLADVTVKSTTKPATTAAAAAAAATTAAAGSTEQRLEVLASGEGELRHLGGDTLAEVSNTLASPQSSLGEQGEANGGCSRDGSSERMVCSDDESSKRHGRYDRREGRSHGRSHGRKRHHRKHKHQHRHRDRSGEEEGGSGGGGGDGRSHRRRSKDHGVVVGPLVPTTTMLAPLKRVPPPASA
ncbi:unnamed protein product, partial [Hapterophycus canaliculatus]